MVTPLFLGGGADRPNSCLTLILLPLLLICGGSIFTKRGVVGVMDRALDDDDELAGICQPPPLEGPFQPCSRITA